MVYKRSINIIILSSIVFLFVFVFIYVNFVKADVSPLSPYPDIRYKIFLTQKLIV